MDNNDIDWSPKTPRQRKGEHFDLERCPAGASPTYIILSREYLQNMIHFWQGRSFPHLKHDCPACAAKSHATWKGYLVAWCIKRRKKVAVEITPPVADELDAYVTLHGTIRGAAFRMTRKNGKPNGRISCDVNPSNEPDKTLPEPFDLKLCLETMWRTDHRPADSTVQPSRSMKEPDHYDITPTLCTERDPEETGDTPTAAGVAEPKPEQNHNGNRPNFKERVKNRLAQKG